jgi:Anaphase-promoting complex, cyclosome, subunit 4
MQEPLLTFNRKAIAHDFMLDRAAISECIEIACAAVEVLSLMADVTRKEIQGFSHFMVWLRGRRSTVF